MYSTVYNSFCRLLCAWYSLYVIFHCFYTNITGLHPTPHDIVQFMFCTENCTMFLCRCMSLPMAFRGSLHTSQISHLLFYPSLWLLVPGLSSQFLPLFPVQPAFNIISGRQYLREMATRFCKLREPLALFSYYGTTSGYLKYLILYI